MKRASALLVLLALVVAASPLVAQAPGRVVVFEEFGNPG
jgi:hypothetical protein